MEPAAPREPSTALTSALQAMGTSEVFEGGGMNKQNDRVFNNKIILWIECV